jgi:hypothetical protein
MDQEGTRPLLSFEKIREYLHPDKNFVGPRQPIDDYRLAAGLLFHHWNDRTDRVIKNYLGDCPTIEVTWYGGRHGISFRVDQVSLPVTPQVVNILVDKRCIEGTPELGYTNRFELRLSDHGKRLVVMEWFVDSNFYDFMTAGATFDPRTGEMDWRSR